MVENIEKVVFINLDRRTDRREQIESELREHGLESMRFKAIERTPAWVGCLESHLEVLKMAQKEKWKNVLIFEDDFTFLVDKATFEESMKAFFSCDIAWDVVMFAYHANSSKKENDLLSRVLDAQTGSGYLVNENFYHSLIECFERALPLLIKTGEHWKYLNDAAWKVLQPVSDWFLFNTRIGKQRRSYSDLAKTITDYGC